MSDDPVLVPDLKALKAVADKAYRAAEVARIAYENAAPAAEPGKNRFLPKHNTLVPVEYRRLRAEVAAGAEHFARVLDHLPGGRRAALARTSLEEAYLWADRALVAPDA